LVKERIQSVLVEGGSAVLGSFADSRSADRAHIFLAPKIIGGIGSATAVGGRGVTRVADSLELRTPKVEQIGPDILISGALSKWVWARDF